MEQQIACFTCGYRIGPVFEKIRRWQDEVLFLSPQDALDKAQVKKECCRMTVMAQSGVEERVRAVGRPTTGEKGVMTVEVPSETSYPYVKPIRVRPAVQTGESRLAENLENRGSAGWTIYEGPKPGMILQPEVAKGSYFRDSSKPPLAEKTPETFSQILISGWNIVSPDSYPLQDWLNVIRPEDKVVYIPVAPFSDIMVRFQYSKDSTTKVAAKNTVREFVHELAAFTRSPNATVQAEVLKSATVVQHGDLLLKIFEKEANEEKISLSDVYGGKMQLTKTTKGPKPGSIVLVFDTHVNAPYHPEPKHSAFVSKLENYIKRSIVDSVEETPEGGLNLTLAQESGFHTGTFVLSIEEFDIKAIGSNNTEDLLNAVVRSVVLSKMDRRKFMIVLSIDEKIMVLECMGPVTGTKDGLALDIVYPF